MAPSYLENIYGTSQAVSQVFVSTDSKSEGIIAVIVPERDYILKRLTEKEGKIHRFDDKPWEDY